MKIVSGLYVYVFVTTNLSWLRGFPRVLQGFVGLPGNRFPCDVELLDIANGSTIIPYSWVLTIPRPPGCWVFGCLEELPLVVFGFHKIVAIRYMRAPGAPIAKALFWLCWCVWGEDKRP